jgi:hypothetical protein
MSISIVLGLPAQGISPITGDPVGGYVVSITFHLFRFKTPSSTLQCLQTWGGGSDSYFEYLIKFARLTNANDSFYDTMWKTAVDSSIKTLRSVSFFAVVAFYTLCGIGEIFLTTYTHINLDFGCRQPCLPSRL